MTDAVAIDIGAAIAFRAEKDGKDSKLTPAGELLLLNPDGTVTVYSELDETAVAAATAKPGPTPSRRPIKQRRRAFDQGTDQHGRADAVARRGP